MAITFYAVCLLFGIVIATQSGTQNAATASSAASSEAASSHAPVGLEDMVLTPKQLGAQFAEIGRSQTTPQAAAAGNPDRLKEFESEGRGRACK